MPLEYKDITFSDEFFKPILDVFHQSNSRYTCHSHSDIDHLKVGIERCVDQVQSGRDFIQKLGDNEVRDLSVSHFFKSLKSKRRLQNITSVCDLLAPVVAQKVTDPFEQFNELKNWDIYAVDGHYQEHATHDPVHKSPKGKESRPATGQFFRLNLRTHHMSLLDTMQPGKGRKKEHDMKVIKRVDPDELRNHAPKGRKVMLVWDKACIDYGKWHQLKHNNGVYFVTMEKSNSAAITCSTDQCDHSDLRNEGILSEEYVGVADGDMLRRITYKNPLNDEVYRYLTNDFTIPAYLIVTFYKHRWDIEKVYYEFKSKFCERKSWASGVTAKKSQAIFQCLLHNLCLLMEKQVEEAGLVDIVSKKRDKGRKRKKPTVYLTKIVQRASHRTFVFIRWVRTFLENQGSYTRALKRLNRLYTQDL